MTVQIWMMALVACAMAPAQSRVTCSSDDGARKYCDADTRNGVVLSKQLSQDRCIQDRTWGFDKRGIWVDRGCRAEFAISPAANRPGMGLGHLPLPGRPQGASPSVQSLTCESNNGKRQWCRQDDTSAQVRLVKQRSDSKCKEGYSWGTAPGSVWVDHGCRADFEVRSGR